MLVVGGLEVELDVEVLLDVEDLLEVESTELLLLELPHVPDPGWHPVPQYVESLPQYPYCEQQLPNVDPRQVIVLLQEPSILTLCTTDEVEVGAVDVPVTLVLEVDVDDFEDEEELGIALPALRYQLEEGSPRQSPTVTDLNPLAYIEARI